MKNNTVVTLLLSILLLPLGLFSASLVDAGDQACIVQKPCVVQQPAPQPRKKITPPPAQPNNTIDDQLRDVVFVEAPPESPASPRGMPEQKLRPKSAYYEGDDFVEVNLEKVDLLNLLAWVTSIFKVDFISGDAFNPNTPGKVGGNVITFKTNAALTKAKAWDLFLTFLDMINLALVPTQYENGYPTMFRVELNATDKDPANKSPVPSFVGVGWRDLPDDDTKIRYIYFVQNSTSAGLLNIIKDFASKSAYINQFASLNALLIADKSSNVRTLMQIVQELDSVSMPEAMSVLKLNYADVNDVAQLYASLVKTESSNASLARLGYFGPKKQQTTVYFPENTQIIPEPRTNSLIILGNKEGIEKVEDFILNYVDTSLKQPYSPLYVYDLQHANADDVVKVLQQVTAFSKDSKAAQYGGVRDGDKYLQPMTFVSDPAGNRVLIKSEKEDYLKVRDIIQQLDVKQPQIAIEVLIIDVQALEDREFGAQIRNKRLDTLGKNVDFQTSGLNGGTNSGIVINPDTTFTRSLYANLVSLAEGQSPGSTLISIGSQMVGGVWALFKMLQTYTQTNLISHPFLVTTNKFTASVELGESRWVETGIVSSGGSNTSSFGQVDANLSVQITPQINSDGIINMEIVININNFTIAGDPTNANITQKSIKTSANVANGEILAIGGLLRKKIDTNTSKVPVLGNIPIIGWFFKNKQKSNERGNLLIFISPQIVEPKLGGGVGAYTCKKAMISKDAIYDFQKPAEKRDPVHRWFFSDPDESDIVVIDDYLNQHGTNTSCPAGLPPHQYDEHVHYSEWSPGKQPLYGKPHCEGVGGCESTKKIGCTELPKSPELARSSKHSIMSCVTDDAKQKEATC